MKSHSISLAMISTCDVSVCFWFALSLSLSAGVSGIEYEVREETPAGTVVGNVKRDANLTLQVPDLDSAVLRFHLRPSAVPGQQRFFSVDEGTGDLTLTQVIDREALCPFDPTCDLAFDVSVRPVQFYRVIKVVVHVLDINDHYPTFPRDTVVINIPETAAPGATFVLPAAVDTDEGPLGVQEYRLVSEHGTLFQLAVTDQFDGAKDVRLTLGARLDRETVDRYQVTLVAVDGGDPRQSGSVRVEIVVVDSNDNSPRFDQSTYSVEVSEDIPANSTLLRVHATDPDQGQNGEVRYSLAEQTENAYGGVFAIDAETGDVFLRTPVDYERRRGYVLDVQAADMGLGSLPVFTKVHVTVLDVNDNAPEITVNVLTEDDSGAARVAENSAVGTFVAHAAVTDSDAAEGGNGRVECFLDSRALFSLESVYATEYTISTAVSLDREEVSSYELVLTCRDKADTPLTGSATIRVEVGDENDNRPVLGLPSNLFEVRIQENTPSGTRVAKINATDPDFGRNQELLYLLLPLDGTPGDTFSVDRSTGDITALKSLDYERRSSYRFLLNVSDRGVKPLSATSTVIMSILDSNDERPVFDRALYFLTVRENQPPGTLVGRVNATDRDLNPEYARVAYRLTLPSAVFDVDDRTGDLRTLRRLDREEQGTHRVSVTASNPGYPGIETRVNVTVLVEDENDNSPVFLFPGPGQDAVELPPGTGGHSEGTTVARLSAVDRDSGINAELDYDINSGNVDGLFQIDSVTGVITLARKPPPAPHQTRHRLVVIARDKGVPSLLCVADLTVVFNNSVAAAQGKSQEGEENWGFAALFQDRNNVLVLAGAALGFVVVVTCVIVTSVCVRRRHRRHRRREKRRSGGDGSNEEEGSSHRHCPSPSYRGGRGGGGSFASAAGVEACSIIGGGGPCAGCDECDGALMATRREDGMTTFADRIPPHWTGLQQDSGIIAHSDSIPASCSGDALPQQLTPSSSFYSSRFHAVSPHANAACYGHHHHHHHHQNCCCCSHGNDRCGCGGASVLPSSSHRCRVHQSMGPYSPSEAVRMLQPSMKMLSHHHNHHHHHQDAGTGRDHDLESLGSVSTWTDSGRGPSEEDDRLRSVGVKGQGSCPKCYGNDLLAQAGDAVSVIS